MNTPRITLPMSLATSAVPGPSSKTPVMVPQVLIGQLYATMHPAMIEQAYLAAHHHATRQRAIAAFRRLGTISAN